MDTPTPAVLHAMDNARMSTEAHEQKEMVSWFRERYPQFRLCLRVSQSGGYRGKGRAGAIRTAKIKGQGGITGEADIALLVPKGGYGCLLIEHKGLNQGHKLTEAQKDYLGHHNLIGNLAVSTRGIEELKNQIDYYMGL